jgi:hypothetical protein
MAYSALLNPIYQPAMRIISSITNSNPALVTTTFDHLYISGTIVRLDILPGFGIEQANQLIGEITVLSPTQFTMDIDTSQMFPFIGAPVYPFNLQTSQVVPVGENSSQLTAALQNTLPH